MLESDVLLAGVLVSALLLNPPALSSIDLRKLLDADSLPELYSLVGDGVDLLLLVLLEGCSSDDRSRLV